MIVNFIKYDPSLGRSHLIARYLVFDFKGECAGFDFLDGSSRVVGRDRVPMSDYNKKATIWLKSSQ